MIRRLYKIRFSRDTYQRTDLCLKCSLCPTQQAPTVLHPNDEPKPTMASYWYESQQTWLYNTPTFTKIMRRDRFQIIVQCLHSNNNAGALPVIRR
jgi:hypothetical protein